MLLFLTWNLWYTLIDAWNLLHRWHVCFSRGTGCFSWSSSSRSCQIQAWSPRVTHATCTITHDPSADIKVTRFGDQLTRVWLAGDKLERDNLFYLLFTFRFGFVNKQLLFIYLFKTCMQEVILHRTILITFTPFELWIGTQRIFFKHKKLNSVVNQNIIIGKPEHNVAHWNIFLILFHQNM